MDTRSAVLNTPGASDSRLGLIEEFSRSFIDIDMFSTQLDDWLRNSFPNNNNENAPIEHLFGPDELHQFDFALDGLMFQQVLRMPPYIQSDLSLTTDVHFAAEDFIQSAAQGLWEMFWRDDENQNSFPFSVARCIEMDSRCLKKGIDYTALMYKDDGSHVLWDHISVFVLITKDLANKPCGSFPISSTVSQAIFFALHLLFARKLSQTKSQSELQKNIQTAYVLIVDSQVGGVVRVDGDLSTLDKKKNDVYQSVSAWVQQHAHIGVSTVEKVWNMFGSVNWGDIGALQLLLSMFCCIEQFSGSPKRTVAELATQYNVRLTHRRSEWGFVGDEGGSYSIIERQNHGEIEIEEVDLENAEPMKIEPGSSISVNGNSGQKDYTIRDDLTAEIQGLYIGTAKQDEGRELLNIYIGAQPSQLEQSWEEMTSWYLVQRQTRVLNVMKQRGLSSKYFPKLLDSGELLHPGRCWKQSSRGHCSHPYCGTPILITSPVGESLKRIFERDGPLSSKDLLKCCHDCLLVLQSAHLVGIQHANICPENILHVKESDGESYYMLVDWGHAILEQKDRPGISLRFSSSDVLQDGSICPVSDAESLIYVLYFLHGGLIPQFENINSALQWRIRAWARRAIQEVLGEVSIVLKAFADYVNNLSGTPYAVDYGIWLSRINTAIPRRNPRQRR